MQKLSLSKCLPLCRPVNAMVGKKRGVQAKCSDVQKAREVMARRRAAEAEAKAQALAAEQQQADLLLKQQHVEKQLQEAADQQAVSTNHPLPDHPTCSPLVPGSLRSPLFKRPRQDTTQAPMPRCAVPMHALPSTQHQNSHSNHSGMHVCMCRHHSVAHALRIPGSLRSLWEGCVSTTPPLKSAHGCQPRRLWPHAPQLTGAQRSPHCVADD
ncbi:hypothetical protein HaLaN_08168 [Haematococcus lacustris]|uniref:Uncharacterized protein n=1 Tax=Haematococcus lacustris TaxID=44745 RepID=A0A699YRJ6_HAELA|nr:hypothetical protein HaLaN_08168 [Haematococcus lacustris]